MIKKSQQSQLFLKYSFLLWGVLTSNIFSKEISFNHDIRPILSNKCFSCHGPDKHERKAELRLDLSEGSDGAYREKDGIFALKPGSIDDSELWHRIISEDSEEVMPPPEANKKPLTQEEKELIKGWINSGAKYEKFWAFEKPKTPQLPKIKNTQWSDNPIDLFVLNKLESLELEPSLEADKRTLARRLSLDLTGLPPTREEVRRFDADDDVEAYEKLVDSLLSSNQYGEHMARYWLDLVEVCRHERNAQRLLQKFDRLSRLGN